jgi:CelD/BcsL family acetyltransferase involved in cellulose biosynthesis
VEPFCRALLERLRGPDVPAWEVLDLYNVPAGSPTRAALAAAAVGAGLSARESLLQPVPVITLPGDWETYLAERVAKKERQEIRRKLRRAEACPQPVTWRLVDGAAGDLEAQMESFLDLMALNPEKARFLTPAMRAQFLAIAEAVARGGWLRLAFLDVDGQPAAAYLTFDYDGKLWVYNSAIDARFNALSPGWVLLARLIQWALAQGRTAVDFLRGDEDYKFRFGAVPEQIYRVEVGAALPVEPVGGEAACQMAEFEGDFFPPEDVA